MIESRLENLRCGIERMDGWMDGWMDPGKFKGEGFEAEIDRGFNISQRLRKEA